MDEPERFNLAKDEHAHPMARDERGTNLQDPVVVAACPKQRIIKEVGSGDRISLESGCLQCLGGVFNLCIS